MAIRLYNTLSRKKEELVPVAPGKVGLYACGATVYDHSHVGHARSAIVFDALFRYLSGSGFDVTYVRNFTDIDDKIINKANAEKRDWREIGLTYMASFREDMANLNILSPTHEPRATEHIGDMLDLIQKLVDRGFAYAAGGSVYFSVKKYQGYGQLSGRSLDELIAGARVEINERKQDPLDFALWKESKPGEPFWESAFGKGRPGWHIECSAMSVKYLGSPFDIHGGGKDLVFPHHENERAQSECGTGRKFVNHWVHNGFVTVDREKMSKSLGNFFLIKDVLKRYHPDVLRLFFLSTHYRNPIDYTEASIEAAQTALQKLYAAVERCNELARDRKIVASAGPDVDETKQRFHEAMDDDLNTALALSTLFDLAKSINKTIDDHDESGYPRAMAGSNLLTGLAATVGLMSQDPETFSRGEVLRQLQQFGLDEAWVEKAIDDRSEARKAKDYKKADEIRGMLLEKGIAILDTPQGTKWRKK
ncbi:MAG TPA: cysteine--tRNA ligase [Deltaproteobacteria bacterium]|nr:cysteine--tRNA ligase [Deltaproteobacteria bacterium]